MARKKRRSVNKSNVRPIGNASIEVLQKRRAEKPEQRKASREAALRYACLSYDHQSIALYILNIVMQEAITYCAAYGRAMQICPVTYHIYA